MLARRPQIITPWQRHVLDGCIAEMDALFNLDRSAYTIGGVAHMATCMQCGKKGLFLRLSSGYCKKCLEASARAWKEGRRAKAAIPARPKPMPKPSWWDDPFFQYARRLYEGIKKELAANGFRGAFILKDTEAFGVDPDLPENVNEAASLLAYRSLTGRERPESLAEELVENMPGLDYDRAYALMRTKSTIARAALCKFLSLPDMPWYIWRTVHDKCVRPEHALMNGVICNWLDPPNPQRLLDGSEGECVHPGYANLCRCLTLSVIFPMDVKLPARVHVSGKIVTVDSREELIRLLEPWIMYN